MLVYLTALLLSAPMSDAKPVVKRVNVGTGVVLEIEGEKRRVIVESSVIMRKGPLEGLLTRTMKKEHEYILAANVDARLVHTALETARARTGKPVQFGPKFVAPSGTQIRVLLRYQKGGKTVVVNAREWLKDAKTGKDLAHDWVFAGSKFGPNPEGDDKPLYYLANHGDLICAVNIESAMLDLPFRSPKAINARIHEAHTDRIPEIGTKVYVILEPVIEKK